MTSILIAQQLKPQSKYTTVSRQFFTSESYTMEDGWMDGWMDGWTDRQTDGQPNEWTDKGQEGRQTNSCVFRPANTCLRMHLHGRK